jgi:CubicO group peptidase (beta-lactamase class C family)
MVLNGGLWHGRRVVPADYLNASTSLLSPHDMNLMFPRFGLSWWVGEDGRTTAAAGFGRQLLMIDRAKKLVVVARAYTGVNTFEYALWHTPAVRKPGPEHLLLVLFTIERSYRW